MQDLVQEHPRRAAEGPLAGEHLVEDHTQAVHVAAAVDPVPLAAGLLGGSAASASENGANLTTLASRVAPLRLQVAVIFARDSSE
jgi:hypothetical protein